VKFIRDDICIPSLGEKDGKKLTPLFATFFFFILTINLMGLIPIFSTATSNLGVTFGLATITFMLMTVGGMIVHNPVGWFKAFVPHGVPAPVLLLIVPLELIGLVVKSFALAMRLFANMLAGHIVLFSFIGMSVAFGWYGRVAAGLAIGVYLLEVFVAFLQAYVFTLLSAIFIGQVYHPDH
jgi:F-type H+-transporting ATPase subunit a